MLVIRRPQVDVFRGLPRLRFEQEMTDYLLRYFPFEARHAQLQPWVQDGLERAFEQGLTTRYEASLYLSLMAMLGAGFDQDPQLPWVASALNAPAKAPRERIDRVFNAALAFLDATVGPKCAWLVRAKLRLRRLDVTVLNQLPRQHALETRVQEQLVALYPQRAERFGRRAMRELAGTAHEAATSRGATRASSVLIHALHAFLFGAAFAKDHCLPWAAASLNGALQSPDERYRHMHASTLDYVERSFARAR